MTVTCSPENLLLAVDAVGTAAQTIHGTDFVLTVVELSTRQDGSSAWDFVQGYSTQPLSVVALHSELTVSVPISGSLFSFR